MLRRFRGYASDKLGRAINYMLRTPPDMRCVPAAALRAPRFKTRHHSKPIREMQDVIAQFEARERVLVTRAREMRARALEMSREYGRTKNASTKSATLNVLRDEKIQLAHAAKLAQRRMVLQKEVLVMEEAAMQTSTVKALTSCASALRQHGRSVEVGKVDALLDRLDDADDVNAGVCSIFLTCGATTDTQPTEINDAFDVRGLGDAIDDDALANEFESMVSGGDDDAGMPEFADAPSAVSAPSATQRVVHMNGVSGRAGQEDGAANDERAALLAAMQ